MQYTITITTKKNDTFSVILLLTIKKLCSIVSSLNAVHSSSIASHYFSFLLSLSLTHFFFFCNFSFYHFYNTIYT
ncbi:hypothetical protein BDA99DRAFT_94951 [Phascolomyces articulosus]|uniref:Uncharacterized protein n=1 Tax=Phascolomyces articulosus TaxID=60185 RepID=A0AAD5PD46_9FUNG|nr:hypothetical protein BDA99DRAFT_94951 [Phascolomyces articulosus]